MDVFEDKQFSLSKVHKCTKLKAFVNEVLRIAHPVPNGLARTCHKDIRCVKYYSYKNDDDTSGTTTNNNNSNNGIILCDVIDSPLWKRDDVVTVLNNNNNNNAIKVKIEYDYIIPKNTNIEINIAHIVTSIDMGGSVNTSSMINLDAWLKKDLSKENKRRLIPFGVGPRRCPGQTLSVKELYAIFGNLLLKYKILQNGDEAINIQFTFGEIARRISPSVAVKICKR